MPEGAWEAAATLGAAEVVSMEAEAPSVGAPADRTVEVARLTAAVTARAAPTPADMPAAVVTAGLLPVG